MTRQRHPDYRGPREAPEAGESCRVSWRDAADVDDAGGGAALHSAVVGLQMEERWRRRAWVDQRVGQVDLVWLSLDDGMVA